MITFHIHKKETVTNLVNRLFFMCIYDICHGTNMTKSTDMDFINGIQ